MNRNPYAEALVIEICEGRSLNCSDIAAEYRNTYFAKDHSNHCLFGTGCENWKRENLYSQDDKHWGTKLRQHDVLLIYVISASSTTTFISILRQSKLLICVTGYRLNIYYRDIRPEQGWDQRLHYSTHASYYWSQFYLYSRHFQSIVNVFEVLFMQLFVHSARSCDILTLRSSTPK